MAIFKHILRPVMGRSADSLDDINDVDRISHSVVALGLINSVKMYGLLRNRSMRIRSDMQTVGLQMSLEI